MLFNSVLLHNDIVQLETALATKHRDAVMLVAKKSVVRRHGHRSSVGVSHSLLCVCLSVCAHLWTSVDV